MIKTPLIETIDRQGRTATAQRGSALLGSIIVLSLLTAMAVILLFASNTEVKMSHSDVQSKQAFYLAEAATENAREQIRLTMVTTKSGNLEPRLTDAAGTDGAIDFDVDSVRPVFTAGTLTGFTGVGDDVPVIPITPLNDGWFAAFATNDPGDGVTNLTDSNNFLMITGLGVGPNGSFEVAQAIIQPGTLFPTIPATILLLGPDPELKHGSGKGWAGIECPKYPDDPYLGQSIKGSKIWVDGALVKADDVVKAYQGSDCAPHRTLGPVVPVGSKLYASLVNVAGGGTPGLFMPTYGAVGATAEQDLEDEMKGSKIDYLSDLQLTTAFVRPAVPAGGVLGEDTIADMTDATEPTVVGSGLGALDPVWQDCAEVKQIVEKLRAKADYVCTPPGCSLPAMTPSTIAFIDGDFRVDCATETSGMLVVTGRLDFPASSSWSGIIFVIGEGEFYRVKKDGFGNISGATVVADIAGPDNSYGTADDCTGGVSGFDSVYFEEQKKVHSGTTLYCSDDIAAADPGFREPTLRRSFRQR